MTNWKESAKKTGKKIWAYTVRFARSRYFRYFALAYYFFFFTFLLALALIIAAIFGWFKPQEVLNYLVPDIFAGIFFLIVGRGESVDIEKLSVKLADLLEKDREKWLQPILERIDEATERHIAKLGEDNEALVAQIRAFNPRIEVETEIDYDRLGKTIAEAAVEALKKDREERENE